jgi:hypothetical protein
MPDLQAQSPEFKHQFHSKRKRKKRRISGRGAGRKCQTTDTAGLCSRVSRG